MHAPPSISPDLHPYHAECDACHRWALTTGPHGVLGFRLCARCLGVWAAVYGAQHLRDEEE